MAPLQGGLSVEEDGENEEHDDENSFSVKDEDEEDREARVRYSISKEPLGRSERSANELIDEWGFVHDKDNEE